MVKTHKYNIIHKKHKTNNKIVYISKNKNNKNNKHSKTKINNVKVNTKSHNTKVNNTLLAKSGTGLGNIKVNKTKYKNRQTPMQLKQILDGGGDFEFFYQFWAMTLGGPKFRKINALAQSDTKKITFIKYPKRTSLCEQLPFIKISSKESYTYTFTFIINPILATDFSDITFATKAIVEQYKATYVYVINRKKTFFSYNDEKTFTTSIPTDKIKAIWKQFETIKISIIIQKQEYKKVSTSALSTIYYFFYLTRNKALASK